MARTGHRVFVAFGADPLGERCSPRPPRHIFARKKVQIVLAILCLLLVAAKASAGAQMADTTCTFDGMCIKFAPGFLQCDTLRDRVTLSIAKGGTELVLDDDALDGTAERRKTEAGPSWRVTTKPDSFDLVYSIEIFDDFSLTSIDILYENEVRGGYHGSCRTTD